MIKVSGRKVLVTGGAGFIGSHTVDALVNLGADVAVVDNLSTGREGNLNPQARFYHLNLAEEALEGIIDREKPEVIYHFGFFVLVPKSVDDPFWTWTCFAALSGCSRKPRRSG